MVHLVGDDERALAATDERVTDGGAGALIGRVDVLHAYLAFLDGRHRVDDVRNPDSAPFGQEIAEVAVGDEGSELLRQSLLDRQRGAEDEDPVHVPLVEHDASDGVIDEALARSGCHIEAACQTVGKGQPLDQAGSAWVAPLQVGGASVGLPRQVLRGFVLAPAEEAHGRFDRLSLKVAPARRLLDEVLVSV